jgi:hypothetical protein
LALLGLLVFCGGLLAVATGHARSPDVSSPLPTPTGGASLAVNVTAVGPPTFDAGAIELPPRVVAGATLRVAFQREDGVYVEVGRGRTDSAGRLALQGLPQGAAWLIATAPGLARGTRVVELGSDKEATVQLVPANQLVVTVKDEQGVPIPGATLLVEAQQGRPQLAFGALTDANGRGEFSRLPGPPWSLKVFARGYESASREPLGGDAEVVLKRLGSLRVRVVDQDEQPVAGARVLLVSPSLWPARQVSTDSSGQARVAGLFPDRFELRASQGDQVTAGVTSVVLERGEERDVVLRLGPGHYVNILVEHETGDYSEPVAAAHVVLADAGVSAFPLLGRTNAKGRVRLGPVASGVMVVSASAPGFIGGNAIVLPPDAADPFRVSLYRGGKLRGEVVDQLGRPIDGARVEVIGTDIHGQPIAETPLLAVYRDAHFTQSLTPQPITPAGELGVTLGEVPYVNQAVAGTLHANWASVPPEYTPWITDFQGEFLAAPIPAGRVRALVRHPAYVEAWSDEVTLGFGGEAQVRVVLLEGDELTGRVISDAGRPVAGVRVKVTAIRGSFERSAFSGADGRFSLLAVPEDVVVALARPEQLSRFVVQQTLSLRDVEGRDVELVLPAERDAVRFRIIDQRGRPIELAQVSTASLDPQVPLRETRFSDAEGWVVFEDIEGLQLRVKASAPGYVSNTQAFARAAAESELMLRRGVLVRGRVTAVRGRQSVEGARVELSGSDLRQSSITTSLGSYEFRNVPTGQVTLRVSHPEYATARRNVAVEETGRLDRAFELPDIDLMDAATLSGQVVDAEGEPVVGARVSLSFISAFVTTGGPPEDLVLTNEEGAFSISGVEGGRQTLFAYYPGLGRAEFGLEIEPSESRADIELRLHPQATEAADPNLTGGGVAITLGERDGELGVVTVIVHVVTGSEAERAGLLPGDVIVAVDGAAPQQMADARSRLQGRPGSDVVLEVERDRERLSFRVRREATSR